MKKDDYKRKLKLLKSEMGQAERNTMTSSKMEAIKQSVMTTGGFEDILKELERTKKKNMVS